MFFDKNFFFKSIVLYLIFYIFFILACFIK